MIQNSKNSLCSVKLDNLVDHQELNDELQSLDDLLGELQEEEEAAPVKTPEPRVH